MQHRSFLGVLVLSGLVIPFTSCNFSPSLTSITVTPSSYTAVLAPCGNPQVTTNFIAIGNYTRPGHTTVTEDITKQVTWTSLTPTMVAITSSGAATVTCQMYGSTVITASAQGFHGDIVGSATFNVEQFNNTSTSDVVSISLTPSNPILTAVGQTVAFEATGTRGTGTTVSVTTASIWTSSNPAVASINPNTGVATAVATGSTTITATYTNSDGVQAMGTTLLTIQ